MSDENEKVSVLYDTIRSGEVHRGKIFTKEALVNLCNKQELRVKHGVLFGKLGKSNQLSHVISELTLTEDGSEVILRIGAVTLNTPDGKVLKDMIEKGEDDLKLEFLLRGYCTTKDGKINNILLKSIDIVPKSNNNPLDEK